MDNLKFIAVIPFLIVFIIFHSIARSKTKKYINEQKIEDGKTVLTALSLTFLTYFVTLALAVLAIGHFFYIFVMLLAYGVLGTVAHIFTRGHRIMHGENDVTTILSKLTYHCWQVLQYIALVVTAIIDIIISLFVDDWKATKKSIRAKEQSEKYFREVSVDKPSNYSDGLNIEYRKFIETTSAEDSSSTRKAFASEYFKSVYNK